MGVTVDAIRGRLRRGTLDSERESGTVYVWVEPSELASQRPSSDESELLEALRDQVRYLREQLDEERQARTEERRRQDTIIVQLTQLIPGLESPQSREDAPESPRSTHSRSEAAGEAQEPAEHPEERPVTEPRRESSPSALTTRLGMSARALAIGAIATLLTWFYVFAVRVFGAHTLPGFNFYMVHLPNYVATAPLALVPLLFGLWAGSTKRPSLPWFSSPHRWLRRGGRSALEISIFAAGLPAWAGWAISSSYYLSGAEITPGVLRIGLVYAVGALIWGAAGTLAFMSGAFLGNSLGRVGIIGTPKEPPEGEEESGSKGVWTARQESRWGIIGGIITASIPAIATVIAALLEGK